MAAEHAYTKTTDNVFDGGKGMPFEEYHFDLLNQFSYQAMVGKSEIEKYAAASMIQILERSGCEAWVRLRDRFSTGTGATS